MDEVLVIVVNFDGICALLSSLPLLNLLILPLLLPPPAPLLLATVVVDAFVVVVVIIDPLTHQPPPRLDPQRSLPAPAAEWHDLLLAAAAMW